MSFEQTLAEYVASSLTEYGAAYTRAMLPNLIGLGVEQGLSGAEMLRQMRAADFGIRTQTFYSLLNTVNQAIQGGATYSSFDPTQVPGETDYTPWEVQRGTGYLTRFNVLVRDAAGNDIWLPRAIKTPVPVAPGELMQDMADYFLEPPPSEGGTGYEETFMGIQLAGLYQLIPEG